MGLNRHGGERALRKVRALNPGQSQPNPRGNQTQPSSARGLKPQQKPRAQRAGAIQGQLQSVREAPGSPSVAAGQGGCATFPGHSHRTGGLCHTPGTFPPCCALLAQPGTLWREGSRQGGVAQPVLWEGCAAWPGPSGAPGAGGPCLKLWV